MTWLYHFRHRWLPDGKNPVQSAYLRPAQAAELDGSRMVGDIVEIHVCALDYYFDMPKEENPFANDEGYDIYFNRLGDKPYYIKDEANIPAGHYLMAHAEVYLKAREFDQTEFWQWVQSYFVLKNYQWTELEETGLEDFPETNALLSMFSLENVKKMEGKLGKDWWIE